MNRDFWQARWDEGHIGFHQAEINPYLQDYWSKMNVTAGATVFVPLCGKSRDMLWLREQGHSVIGVEIVPKAVEGFFAENNLSVNRQTQGPFELWETEGIRIYQGDFFELNADALSKIGAVYDRASLIALPPPMRQRYATHLCTILPGKRNILLVTMDYPQAEMDGPPFAVTEQEVAALYQHSFDIDPLCNADILAANPRFQQQGLSRLSEKVYALRAR